MDLLLAINVATTAAVVVIVWRKTGAAIVERRSREPGRETSFRFLELLAMARARKTPA